MPTPNEVHHQPFTKVLWEAIEHQVREIKRNVTVPVAAFDVDGTLWDGDIAELFLSYQITHRLLPDLPRDPWAHYFNLMIGSEEEALMWLAQINAGQRLETVRKWAKDCFLSRRESMVFFHEQKRLIDLLVHNGFEVYCVSGSVQWAVEPLAEYFGIPAERVAGMRTHVKNGTVTAEPARPFTWRKGKVRALLAMTGGRSPQICSGNTMGDFALLNAATHLRLAVTSQPRNQRLETSEKRLQEEAAKNGWATHSFA